MKPPILVCLLLVCLVLTPCLAQTVHGPARPTARPGTPSPAPPPATPPPVIQAVVNGSPISDGNVNQAIANHWATPILRGIIEDRLVRQEARKLGVTLSAPEVAGLFEAERAKFASQAAFDRALHAQGYSAQGYVEKLTTETLLKQLMDRVGAVSDDEIKRYYLDRQKDFSKPAQAHVYVIATDTIEEAYLVRERLAAGDKFDTIAKELSKHPSKDKGGDLGWVGAAELPDKATAEAALTMEPGVISSPLRTGNQFYVMMVKERRQPQIVSLDEARPQIVAKLREKMAISRQDYLDMLARKASISVSWAPAKALAQEYQRLRTVGLVVNGKPLELAQAPVMLPNGTTIVPAKPVLQAIGAVLTWQAKDQSLFAVTATGKVKLTLGSPKLIVGNDKLEARDMKQPPVMREGTLFIAPRVPLEALGATVEWDGVRNRLVIETSGQDMPSPTTTPRTPSGLERQ